jgi:acyl-CoA dehydrogenase family protein 9
MGLFMKNKNFLENLYFGYLDTEVFRFLSDSETEDQIRELIKRFHEISQKFPASDLEKIGMVPKELLAELNKIGFFGLDIPKVYGGLGLRLPQYLKVVENVATRNIDLGITALAHLSIGTKGILLFGTEEQKRKYLVPAASGQMIFSYALTEPRIGSDAKHIETTAVLDESGEFYILSGQKSYITNASYAGGLTVFAQIDPQRPGFLGAFIVETAWDGVKIGQEMPKMGLKASSTAAIKFNNVRVPKENLLGQPGDGFKIAMTVLNFGRLALGAASAGVMKLSLKDMVKRSKGRVQFGVSIHRFQLIQEKLVKAKVNSYAVAAMTALTAAMLARDPFAPVAIESSHCKLFGTTKAWDTLYDALQVAGGSGYLSTNPYEKRMRDFRVTTIFEGTTEIHSIYPALYFMRDISRQLAQMPSKKIAFLIFLIKGIFLRTKWHITFAAGSMQQATRIGKSLARRIRYMVLTGILLYRENVFARQYFLRRITYLSLYLFAIVAMLARIEASRLAGYRIEEDLKLLELFSEQARQVSKKTFACYLRAKNA